ncbi:MAG: hypothetical protein V3T53_04455 [Phycisphaerales bacterium]
MATATTQTDRILTAVAIAIMVLLSACSSEDPDPMVSQPPPVDPRFASADALLEYYNQVAMQQPKVDSGKGLSLMFAETPLQERLLALYRDSLPLLELEDACWEQYGVGLSPSANESPFSPAKHTATMTERDTERAKAKQRQNDGSLEDIYLVKLQDRWWISGYTLEYDQRTKSALKEIDTIERRTRYLAAVAPIVTADVRSGKWKEAGEVAPSLVYLRLVAHVFTKFPETRNMRDLFGLDD